MVSVKDGAADRMTRLRSRLCGARLEALLPLALLLAAMSSVFAFGNGSRGMLHRAGPHHAWVSSQHLTIAANLSPKHNFLMYMERALGEDGTVEYAPYNRFPIGGYALMKLAILPFGDSLSAQIYAARTLMLALFAATAALAYLAVSRLVGSRWAALSATLLAFSSGYLLFYNDMTSNEVGMDLFGVTLAFHGMVVFAQEGRFRQLLFKACVAVCLGWHAYALLLPFIAIGVAGELVGALRASSALPALARAGRVSGALVRSRHIALGAVALALGLALLAFNFGNEYAALRGETPLAELPSAASALDRTGIQHNDASLPRYLGWMAVLETQFSRIGASLVPFAADPGSGFLIRSEDSLAHLILGLAAAAACAAGLFYTRHKALWATLAVSGLCWALPMRRTSVVHNYEAVYHVGIPLFLFALILIWVGKRHGARAVRDLSIAAAAIFVVSAFQMNQSFRAGDSAGENGIRAARAADFDAIRSIAKDKKVYMAQGVPEVWENRLELQLYMRGIVFVWEYNRGKADFIVSGARQDADALLTPDNSATFLYDNSGGGFLAGAVDSLVDGGTPIYRGEYDVYAHGGRVYYIGAPGTFQAAALSEGSPAVGERIEAKLNIGRRIEEWRWERGKDGEGWAAAPRRTRSASNRIYIPGASDAGYRIRARVNYIDKDGVQSEAIAAPTEAVSEFRAAGGGRRGGAPRFFLHAIPADENDLAESRKPYGFDNLDFSFDAHVFDHGRDMRRTAMVELPPYPIGAIKTGQFTRGGNIWSVRARLDGDGWIVEERTGGGG